MSKPRSRAVKVVEFHEEPGAKEKSRKAGPTSHAREALPGLKRKREQTFRETYQEVMELGATNLDKRSKKKHEIEKLAELGVRRPGNPKIPLKVLFSMKKTHAKRDAKKKAEEEASGIVTGAKQKSKRSNKSSKEKSRDDDIHKWANGSFHGGVLRLRSTKSD